MENLLTPENVSKILEISIQTLSAWRVYGTGPRFVRVGGNRIRYRREDVESFIQENLVQSTSDPGGSHV